MSNSDEEFKGAHSSHARHDAPVTNKKTRGAHAAHVKRDTTSVGEEINDNSLRDVEVVPRSTVVAQTQTSEEINGNRPYNTGCRVNPDATAATQTSGKLDASHKEPLSTADEKPAGEEFNEPYDEEADPRKKKRTLLLIVGVACVLIAVAALSYMLFTQWQLYQAQQRLEATGTATAVKDASADLVDNPVDFISLKTENSDIYAWIYIPDTNVNYPIVQSMIDDNYYLTRTVEGYESVEGAIYTQSCNKLDFSDPVTVVYGHNIHTPEMMFHQLHLFEDADFFDSHDTFYIYVPDRILTYQIVAAYEYDNRHIINAHNFSDPTVVQDYFSTVLAPNSLVANVRTGVTLTANNKIVQLSTCVTSGSSSSRYIVTGKLVNEQYTKQ